jgi:hypothetical protein
MLHYQIYSLAIIIQSYAKSYFEVSIQYWQLQSDSIFLKIASIHPLTFTHTIRPEIILIRFVIEVTVRIIFMSLQRIPDVYLIILSINQTLIIE